MKLEQTVLPTGDFISQAEVTIYEDLQEFTTLKRFMEDSLDDYNSTPGVISMDLVLFRDAIEHGKVSTCTSISKSLHCLK